MRPISGLSDIIALPNLWMHEEQRIEHPLIMRYEDVRSDPDATLARIIHEGPTAAAHLRALAEEIDVRLLDVG
jgi:hypothetical protein